MGDTVQRPGGDAAVIRVQDTQKALAITTDCTPRYCLADPVMGGKQAVAETWRNLTAVGARPLGITDNMNFGNPERPDIMGQFVGAIQGIGAACTALEVPVVSGNVSLYNETNGEAILPTPEIGAVGLLADYTQAVGMAFPGADLAVYMIGETQGHLGQSLYLREIAGREEGAPPPVDLERERKIGDFVRREIGRGIITSCHDISDGGLLVALAEMALAADIGITITAAGGTLADHAWAFGEDQARYLVTANDVDFAAAAEGAGVPVAFIGRTGGGALVWGAETLTLNELRTTHEGWLPDYMVG
tara:strand:- start:281 stop:1192 length:912 start_codon:yes stop_codon:yes gene_type:complete